MRAPSLIFSTVSAIAVAFLVGYPLAHLFFVGGTSSSAVSFWRLAGFTYGQAFLSALLSGIVGVLGALLYSEQNFFWRRFLWRSSLVCFSLPPILAVLCFVSFWRALLGQSWYGLSAILLVHVFFNFSLYLKAVGNALAEMDRSPEKAALMLGASRSYCFFKVTLPKLLPSIKAAFWLSFLYSAMSFLVVLLLGGGPRYTTLEVAVYGAVKIDFDLALASRLALFQLGVALAVYLSFIRQPDVLPTSDKTPFVSLYKFFDERKNAAARFLYAGGLFFLALGPLAALFVTGFWSLPRLSLSELTLPLWTTLKLGLSSAMLSLALAFPMAYSQRHSTKNSVRISFSVAANLSLSVSTILLTLSWMLAYPELLMSFRGSLLAVALAQAVGSLPLSYAALCDGFARVPQSVLSVSASLGAGPWRTLAWVEWPALRPSLLLAFLLAFAYSFGEVGAVLMFVSDDIVTLPLAIYRSLSHYEFDAAYAMGALLVSCLLGVHWAAGRLEA